MNGEMQDTSTENGEAGPLRFRSRLHLRGLLGWGIERVMCLQSPAPAEAPPPDLATPPRPLDQKAALEQQAQRVASCRQCDLCESRHLTAFGTGDADADLMFVGEAPGQQEDLRGEPFVGPAGQLLDRIIEAMGLRREQVYIANVLKCRPPGNRDPQPQEVNACGGHLESQILTIQPKILVALGRPAACWLTGLDTSLAQMRGQEHDWRGIPVVATYHPAYLLRQEQFKARCWQDLQRVIQALDLPGGRARS